MMPKMLALLILIGIFSVSSAFAGPIQLQLLNGARTVTVADNGTGDLNPAAGVIAYVGAVGNWGINVSAGVLGIRTMDLNPVAYSTVRAPGDLTILFSMENATTTGPGPFELTYGGTNHKTTGNFQVYWSETSTFFAPTHLIGTLGTFTASAF